MLTALKAIDRTTLYKYTFIGLFISYLASSAMMFKFAENFLFLMFLLSLLKANSIGLNFKHNPIFRFFCISLLLIFLLVLTSSIIYLEWIFLFSYKFEVFRNLLILPFIFNALLVLKITKNEIMTIILLTAGYALFYSIAVFISSPTRGYGLLSGPIQRGNLAVLYAILALIFFYHSERLWQQTIALITFISGIILSLQTGSKGGWLAIILSLTTLFILISLYDKQKLKQYLLKVFLISLCVYMLWEFLPVQTRLESAIDGFINYFWGDGKVDGSVGARLEIWKVTLLGILNFDIIQILLGKGFMSFTAYYQEAQQAGLTQFSAQVAHPHNDFLKITYEYGVIGLLLFSSIFIYPAMKLVNTIKQDKSFMYIGLAGIMLIEMLFEFMLTDSAIFTKQLFYTYILLIFLITISTDSKALTAPKNNQGKKP